jgi:predicted DCC family thiol-disulfide oxidoreductase YuxK
MVNTNEERFKHLVFYDGNCGLCDRIVRFLYKADQKEQFAFATLKGETASIYLKNLSPEIKAADSLILIENYRSSKPRIFLFGKGALRIAWLLGWPWLLIGWLSFLPGFLFNWGYRLVARNRHRFFPQDQCFIPPPNQKDRFPD